MQNYYRIQSCFERYFQCRLTTTITAAFPVKCIFVVFLTHQFAVSLQCSGRMTSKPVRSFCHTLIKRSYKPSAIRITACKAAEEYKKPVSDFIRIKLNWRKKRIQRSRAVNWNWAQTLSSGSPFTKVVCSFVLRLISFTIKWLFKRQKDRLSIKWIINFN